MKSLTDYITEKMVYNKANASYSESILDSYEMYWPIDNGTQPLSSYHTCIPFVKNTDIVILNNTNNQEPTFKIGESDVPCHPFGAIVSVKVYLPGFNFSI